MHRGKYFENPERDPERLRAEREARDAVAHRLMGEERQRKQLHEQREAVAQSLYPAIDDVLDDLIQIFVSGSTVIPSSWSRSVFRPDVRFTPISIGGRTRAEHYNREVVKVTFDWTGGSQPALNVTLDDDLYQKEEIATQLGKALHTATGLNVSVWYGVLEESADREHRWRRNVCLRYPS